MIEIPSWTISIAVGIAMLVLGKVIVSYINKDDKFKIPDNDLRERNDKEIKN